MNYRTVRLGNGERVNVVDVCPDTLPEFYWVAPVRNLLRVHRSQFVASATPEAQTGSSAQITSDTNKERPKQNG